MPWLMGVLVVSMLAGAFSSALGLDNTGRGMINQNETALTEGASTAGNWFDPGWQRNEESGGMPVDPTATETTTGAAAGETETNNDKAEAETIEITDVSNDAKGAKTENINSNEIKNGVRVNVLGY